MKVLLIEDSDEKANAVSSLLRSKVNKVEILRAKSFRSGVKKLETTAFDLLVLDMVLPLRDGEQPNGQAGKNVLAEINDTVTCRRPSHIVCLTAFTQIAQEFKDEAKSKLIHVVIYNELEATWRDLLAEKARQIEKRINEANIFPEDYRVDVAIVTSSPKVELNEVLKLPGFIGEFHQKDGLHYYSSSWLTVEKKSISVVACAAPSMGMTAACITASKVIERWRPRYLVMTGIAASTKKEQKFGDIIVAESAFDYGSGKITQFKNNKRLFTPSYMQIRIDAALQALLQRWEREQLYSEEIKRAWHGEVPSAPKIILGVLASGAAVVQSKKLVAEILEQSRKVVGLDMEAFGIFHAAHLATNPAPRVLVAKSVSDFADGRKNDDWQQYAAFSSANFVFQFFTKETELKICK